MLKYLLPLFAATGLFAQSPGFRSPGPVIISTPGGVSQTILTNGIDGNTAATIAATNAAWANTNGNGQFVGNGILLTNLSLDYVYPAPYSISPTPYLYALTEYGTNRVTEGDILRYINLIYTNGYKAFGWRGVQMDAGWAARDGSGKLIANPATFTNDLAYICRYAAQRGLVIGAYYSINTNPAVYTFGQIPMHTNMLADLDVMATNGIKWIKVDTYNSPQSGQDPISFWNAVAKTGAPIHRQVSVSDFGNRGNYYALSPAMASGLNSAYVALGLPDTSDIPLTMTNSFGHWLRSLAARHLVSPSLKLEGTGWLKTGFRNQYDYPQHCFVDMALMTAEPIISVPDVDSYSMTNSSLWSLFQQSPVTVPDIVITNGDVVVASKVVGNAADGLRAVLVANGSTATNTTTYNLPDLGFAKNAIVTYYHPWFGNSLEGWATNSISITVRPTNTQLYVVATGYKSQIAPAGFTYLSDLAWDSTASIPRGPSYTGYGGTLAKDYRDGVTTTPLIIGSTTYTKGFGVGGGIGAFTNAIWTINTGYAQSQSPQLYFAFGKQQAWNGGSSGIRITVWTNGVLCTQSGFVTNNTTQSTNFTIPYLGVRSVTFMTETNGVVCQGVVGGCYITNSIP